MQRRLPLLLPAAICMLVFACACACSPPARAGTYVVWSCWAGSDSFLNPNANGTAWTKTSDSGGQYNAFDQCGATDNGLGVISVGGYEAPSGRWGEVSFAAARGTQIMRLRLWRTAWSTGSGSGGDAHRNFLKVLSDGNQQPLGDNFDGSSEVPMGAAG